MLQDNAGRTQINESKILTYYPYVSGLEEFEKMKLDTGVLQTQIEELKKYVAISNTTENNEN
ncbi:MAG: hypothetical protein V1777_01285 [Candidatus Micrarchaeota archaeon]